MNQNTNIPTVKPQSQTAASARSSGQRSLTDWKRSPASREVPLSPPANDPPAQPQTAPPPIDFQPQQPVPAPRPTTARRIVVPKSMHLEPPQPLSAINDDPVFAEDAAGTIIGVSAECMKKWRQRGQGPDYVQYGVGGPVRYALSALMAYRAAHTVRVKGNK